MIDSFIIENFKGFAKLTVPNLRRINIVVGRNSSGKTALLEALFLTLGNSPEMVFRLRRWRGMGENVKIMLEKSFYESLWQDLFFSLNTNAAISLTPVGLALVTRPVRIFYQADELLTIPLGDQQTDPTRIVPITFEWKDPSGKVFSVQPTLTPQGLQIGIAGLASPGAFFSSFLVPDPQENAARFSELSKARQERDFVDVIHREFPWIETLSIEVSGGIPQIYASLSSQEIKLPVTFVSGGINKLMSILLGMASFPKGLILIDEVENGFYYDRLRPVWSMLLHFSQKYDNQVFTSTHSYECLKASIPIIKNNEEEFCLIRLEREGSQSKALVFTGKDLVRAIEQEIEVR